MRITNIFPTILSLAASMAAVQAQSFCSSAQHSGQSVKETGNKVGSIGGVGYELWFEGGNNSATFYSDGSFSCSFQGSKDYLCRTGLSFNSDKTYQQIGHMFADFKLVKQGISNVDYSYVGIYGWTRNPLVEFYIVDNWLSPSRPGDWVGNRKHGDFTIDGAKYTVYENTRNGPSIDGNTNFKQYFSIRQQARDCGTIDINAHFEQWEKLGMQMGKMHEAKILGEAGSNGGGTSGTADFPYAKVYIGQKSDGGAGAGGDAGAGAGGDAGAGGNTGGDAGAGGNTGGDAGAGAGAGGDAGNGGNGGNGGFPGFGGGFPGFGGGNGGGFPGFGGGNGGGFPGFGGGNGGGFPGFGGGDNGGNGGAAPGGDNSAGGSDDTEKKTTTITSTTVKPKPTEEASTNPAPSGGDCSSRIQNQGFKCCSNNCMVFYSDGDGNWGYEDGEWCGCNSTVYRCKNVVGYACCKSSDVKIYETDEYGKWGVEDNKWCLLDSE